MAVATSPAGAVGPNIYGITTTNEVITLTSNLNNNPATVLERHALTGMAAGDVAVGIDRRPADSLLWLVATGESVGTRLYTVDPTTGAATPRAELRDVNNAYAPVTLTGTHFGTDIDKTSDSMRIVSGETKQNLHVYLGAQVGPPFRNPGDTVIDTNTSIVGIQALGADAGGLFAAFTQRKAYAQVGGTPPGSAGTETFVRNLDAFSNTYSGLDVYGSSIWYSRGLATNSSVYEVDYTANPTTTVSTRKLTTPTGTVLVEIAL
jgi:hypothetical protein